MSDSLELWGIGHSTRELGDFLDLLRAHRIEAVADIRRYPVSRRLPHFGAEALEAALTESGVTYVWMPALGGRRRPTPGAPATAWRTDGFKGFAEYLRTADFAEALDGLLNLASGFRTVMMCAEALWWRCHRRLIADVLVSLGVPVSHITDRGAEPHRLVSPARLADGMLTYAPESPAG
jgi:uncharacterized protein (DUF488 family)